MSFLVFPHSAIILLVQFYIREEFLFILFWVSFRYNSVYKSYVNLLLQDLTVKRTKTFIICWLFFWYCTVKHKHRIYPLRPFIYCIHLLFVVFCSLKINQSNLYRHSKSILHFFYLIMTQPRVSLFHKTYFPPSSTFRFQNLVASFSLFFWSCLLPSNYFYLIVRRAQHLCSSCPCRHV